MLNIAVHTEPIRPYYFTGELEVGEQATWAPTSSTLIYGSTEGILIDALLTVEDADNITAWAETFGVKITGIYITHGHSDHWRALARLLEHFPEAKGYAAPEVAARANYELENAKEYWQSRFPNRLVENPVAPESYRSNEILVDGEKVELIHIGQGDIDGSVAYYVPSTKAVVAGDVVYNNIHMMCFEADEAARERWIASIDKLIALKPEIVVAGHKTVGAADLPENLAASQQYLRDFTAIAKNAESVEALVQRMLELHGDREQTHTLWISARAEMARKKAK